MTQVGMVCDRWTRGRPAARTNKSIWGGRRYIKDRKEIHQQSQQKAHNQTNHRHWLLPLPLLLLVGSRSCRCSVGCTWKVRWGRCWWQCHRSPTTPADRVGYGCRSRAEAPWARNTVESIVAADGWRVCWATSTTRRVSCSALVGARWARSAWTWSFGLGCRSAARRRSDIGPWSVLVSCCEGTLGADANARRTSPDIVPRIQDRTCTRCNRANRAMAQDIAPGHRFGPWTRSKSHGSCNYRFRGILFGNWDNENKWYFNLQGTHT